MPCQVNSLVPAWLSSRSRRSPCRHRFHRPYKHTLTASGAAEATVLTIHQQKFCEEGFASTVWDSSIVLAKYFERWPQKVAGKRCLDLSAGCGLVGIALAKLGAAQVVATDLEPNLALLHKNNDLNGCLLDIKPHTWGSPLKDLSPSYDVVTACDVMYIPEAIPDLVKTLVKLSGAGTELLIAHGRNRQAEEEFLAACEDHFTVERVPSSDLDEVYQCTDVDVLHLSRMGSARKGRAKPSACLT